MSEFTFIVTTYNHENFIIEHLESIKNLINLYGKEMEIDLIVADDCSTDNTINILNEWLRENRYLFRNVLIIENKENIGTIKNILNAINNVKTEYFKESAGDDKYYTNNIFELYEPNVWYISPIIPFGSNSIKIDTLKTNYKFLLNANTKDKMKKLLRYKCLIPAPGVFLDSSIYREEKLKEFLYNFKLIEDYPTWYYLLNIRKEKIIIRVLTKPYVCYRVGSGISTNKDSEIEYSNYLEEVKNVNKKVNQKLDKYPKFINPYKYIFKIKTLLIKKKNSGAFLEIEKLYEKIENSEV